MCWLPLPETAQTALQPEPAQMEPLPLPLPAQQAPPRATADGELKSVLPLVIRGARVSLPQQSDFVLQRPVTSDVMLLRPLVATTLLWRVGGARPWHDALIVACETLVGG